jgi:hypothetical protein
MGVGAMGIGFRGCVILMPCFGAGNMLCLCASRDQAVAGSRPPGGGALTAVVFWCGQYRWHATVVDVLCARVRVCLCQAHFLRTLPTPVAEQEPNMSYLSVSVLAAVPLRIHELPCLRAP